MEVVLPCAARAPPCVSFRRRPFYASPAGGRRRSSASGAVASVSKCFLKGSWQAAKAAAMRFVDREPSNWDPDTMDTQWAAWHELASRQKA